MAEAVGQSLSFAVGVAISPVPGAGAKLLGDALSGLG